LHTATLAMRKQALLKAMAVKVKLLDSDDENIRSKAATELIEWELGRATARNEHTGAGGGAMQVSFSWEDMIKRDDDTSSA
ncbi:MAG: hypothetical protein ACPG7F_00850, partial [Aggregatilineales bacterium]